MHLSGLCERLAKLSTKLIRLILLDCYLNIRRQVTGTLGYEDIMKDWIPFLQSLVWPAFFGIIIFAFKDWFKEVLNAIKRRIEEGGELGVGPSGLTLGAAPRLPDDPTPEEIIDDGDTKSADPALLEREKEIERKKSTDPFESLHLVHRTSFLRVKNGRDYYRIVVSLSAAEPDLLSQVGRVVYFLHRTFRNPVREVQDAQNNFALKTAAWGEFTIRADVYAENRAEPIRLSRYIDILPRRA